MGTKEINCEVQNEKIGISQRKKSESNSEKPQSSK